MLLYVIIGAAASISRTATPTKFILDRSTPVKSQLTATQSAVEGDEETKPEGILQEIEIKPEVKEEDSKTTVVKEEIDSESAVAKEEPKSVTATDDGVEEKQDDRVVAMETDLAENTQVFLFDSPSH